VTATIEQSALIEAADHAARHWRSADPRPLRIGTDLHRQAACRMFHETFNPYKPSVIDWPRLDPAALERLTSLPIWDIAVQTEGKARLRMQHYAASLPDTEWREALELNGWEEGRHKEVLANLVQAYGIALMPEPVYAEPRDPEWAYLVTGFSECIDSFFAFGLFELARRSGYFPPQLVDTFEPVIQEEARHILLFANWLAWHRRRLSCWRRARFELRVAVGDVDISPAALMAVCLTENDRRFAGYDPRLLRPTTTPAIARLVCRFARRRQRGAAGVAP
jgi:hypothetical protein